MHRFLLDERSKFEGKGAVLSPALQRHLKAARVLPAEIFILSDPKTGNAIWEMGFGTGNCDEISLISGYLIINRGGHLVLCDAAHGGILANSERPPDQPYQLFDDRVSLVDGRLRAKDYDGALYELTLPKTADSGGGPSPAVQKEH